MLRLFFPLNIELKLIRIRNFIQFWKEHWASFLEMRVNRFSASYFRRWRMECFNSKIQARLISQSCNWGFPFYWLENSKLGWNWGKASVSHAHQIFLQLTTTFLCSLCSLLLERWFGTTELVLQVQNPCFFSPSPVEAQISLWDKT